VIPPQFVLPGSDVLMEIAEMIAGQKPETLDANEPTTSLIDWLDERGAVAIIDWKTEAEDIIWNLQQVVQAQRLPLEVSEERFACHERWQRSSDQTDRALTMMAEELLKQGYAMGFIVSGGDDYVLFLVPRAKQAKLEAISSIISFDFGW